MQAHVKVETTEKIKKINEWKIAEGFKISSEEY